MDQLFGAIQPQKNDTEATRYINCLFEDKDYKGKPSYGNFIIETNYAKKMRFENCRIIAHKKRTIWADPGNAKEEDKYRFINCVITNDQDKVPPPPPPRKPKPAAAPIKKKTIKSRT